MILGTAGHIDHGKTALVRALTGVDTDRLPEEKRRGITIDLGFAPLKLDDGEVIGVVDVPGHEAFVRTMLAGASGVDLALLVIAADEGPMPQTREHLAILQLLQVPRLVVALTKSDLVDADWMALVSDEVRALLADTPYRDAPLVPASAVTGSGLAELRSVIGAEARRAQRQAAADDLFRMPVDRVFSIRGTGTVVTGTVWSGELTADDHARILPVGRTVRLRGLQSHANAVDRLVPGMRAAVAIAGVETQQVARGATLVARGVWESSLIIRADLALLPESPELRPRTRVRFHLATADVGARVVAAGSPVKPGERRTVRIVLDEPIVARAGDRFVLRSASPLATIGGGVITDPLAPRRARPMPALDLTVADRLALFADEAGLHGVRDDTLAVRLGLTPPAIRTLLRKAKLDGVGELWYSPDAVARAAARLLDLVRAHHAQRPLDPGAPRQDVRSRLGIDQALFDHIVADLTKRKKLASSGADLRAAGFGAELSDEQAKASQDLLDAITAAGHEPPSVTELEARFGKQTAPLLRHLERQRKVVQVEDGRYYAPDAVHELLRRLERGMAGRGEVAPAELREVLGFSRKFLIPFLEYCDRRGYTSRQPSGRIWLGKPI